MRHVGHGSKSVTHCHLCSVSSTDVVIEHCHRPGRQVDDDKFLALALASTCIGLDVEGNLLSFQLR